jgi:acetyl-CoA C-acetyltransferase
MSKMGNVLDSPHLKGMTEKELLAWAVLEALNDAGIAPKDVDSHIVGNFMPETIKSKTIFATANEWLGLQKKSGYELDAACNLATQAIKLGGSLIASGMDEIVVSSGTSILCSIIDEDLPKFRKQPAARVPVPPELFGDYLLQGYDQAYVNPIVFDHSVHASAMPVIYYAQKYGLTIDQMDDALNSAAIAMRRGAVRHPKSLLYKKDEYKDIAKKAGFTDLTKYMKSTRHNPYYCWPIRTSHCAQICDGAAAMVLCATENVKKYTTKPPIEVAGVGQAASMYYNPTPDLFDHPSDKAAFEQAYAMADLDPAQIDYLGIHDWSLHYHFLDPELAGYIPQGKAWKALIDGRTAFDGDRPIQTHGGECYFGNPFDPASIIDIAEAVQQMRGECGERQIYRPPKTAVVIGRGAGAGYGVSVLRRKEVL